LPDPVHGHILRYKLASPLGHRVRVQLEKFGNLMVPATTQLERLQAGVQTPLLFVERTPEQDDSRPQFVGNSLTLRHTARHSGLFQTCLPRQ
jgi:hypothetical protein